MKIRRLLLRSYGCLRGEYQFSADRINLILEPNEKGKSTLAAAILAALYGFPPGQRRSETRPILDVDVHRPWSGDDYFVEMDLEAAGRGYTVRRDFAKKDERVLEWKSGKEITAQFQAAKDHVDFAGILTGLSREEFAKTVFLRQSELQELRNPGSITAALQRMATSQQGDVAAAEALETLSEAVRQYRGRKIRRGKVDNEIQQIEEEMAVLGASLEAMEERRRKAEQRIAELKTTSREEGRNDEEIEQLEYLILAAGRKEDADRLEQETREKKELEQLEKQFQELQAYATFPADRRGRLLELKAWLAALADEESRLAARTEEEARSPLEELRQEAGGISPAEPGVPPDLERLATVEARLLAAWRSRKESRRARRAVEARCKREGIDSEKLRSYMNRFGAMPAEDRRFLREYAAREVEIREMLLQAEREIGRVDAEIAGAGGGGAGRASGIALAAGSIVCFAAAAAAWLAGWPPAVSVAAVTAGAALAALRLLRKPASEPSEKVQRLAAAREEMVKTAAGRTAELDGLKNTLATLASKLDAGSGESLLGDFRGSEAHAEEAAEMASVSRQAEEARRELAAASDAVMEMMTAAGHLPRFGAATPGTVKRFRKISVKRAEISKNMEDLEGRVRQAEEETARLAEERRRTLEELGEILSAAGIEPTEDLERAAALFDDGVTKRDRYETLKKEVIPGLVRRSLSHRGESLRKAVEAADLILKRKVEEDPPLADLTVEKTHKEYVEERDRLRREAKTLAERRLELSAELGEVLREYRRDYPDTQRWLKEWSEQRDRAVAFKSAVQIASEVLEEISREAYAEWADVLNERASEVLKIVTTSYGDLRFDEALSFTVCDRRDGARRTRDDVDRRFSAGTRDQIYLAARLALASYLSAGKIRLPLILDDPFASFDDERFSNAMALLIDKFAKRHQIIILSCQETRHRAWQDRNAGRSAERVRLMTLQALAT